MKVEGYLIISLSSWKSQKNIFIAKGWVSDGVNLVINLFCGDYQLLYRDWVCKCYYLLILAQWDCYWESR